MGADKALLQIDGIPMLGHVLAVLRAVQQIASIAVVGRDHLPDHDEFSLLSDDIPGKGPLGGLSTALRHAPTDHLLVVACDMPSLQPALLAHLIALAPDHDAVIPVWDNRYQPLCAIYSSSLYPLTVRRICANRLSMHTFIDSIPNPHFLPATEVARLDPTGLSFRNLNTPSHL
jgi:molybdenum cofactor guanylyltransferase